MESNNMTDSLNEIEIIGWRCAPLSIPENHYRKLHIRTDKAWDCEFVGNPTQKEKLELVNTWNRLGFGIWQYYTG